MKIGINALYLLPGKVGGSETYIRNLVKCFAKSRDDNVFVVFINKESVGIFEELSPHIEVVLCPFSASHRAVRILWEQFLLPFQVWQHKIEILFSAGMTSPFLCSVTTVLVIHDLQHVNQPENYSSVYLCFLRMIVYLSAKTADKVVTISEKVKADIIKFYKIAAENIYITYNAVDHNAFSPRDSNEVETIRKKYRLPEKFVLYAASSLPHKNHIRLFEAMKIIRQEGRGMKLVLVGARFKWSDVIVAKIEEMGIKDDVIFIGWVPFEDLPLIYCASEIFVFPSLHEGFGIPVLEAMACGVPVVCSNIEPITEVAAGAAFLVDPLDPRAIARALCTVAQDRVIRENLITLGFCRAAEFSWEATARKTIDCLLSRREADNV
ncbi:MAG: glycosyltransferase family 1 protein [Thermodesulfovibrionales bacterium]